jgi:hypothetical protein
MKLKTVALMFAVIALTSCGPSPEEFAKQCQEIAAIEVQSPRLWREYLRERKERLSKREVIVEGRKIDATDLDPVVETDSFERTNDWVLQGRPKTPNRKPYRNDHYVRERSTGHAVARFRNLDVSIPSIETTVGYSCTVDHPYLYTGGARHTGSIWSH